LKYFRTHISLTIFLFCCCAIWGGAQPFVKASADKRAIRIGEPISIKLTATWPGKDSFSSGFVIPDSIPHFDIWENHPRTVIKDGFEQNLVVTSYDSGVFAIPQFRLATPDIDIPPPGYATDSIRISIQPVNVDTLIDYHDIKDILEVEPVKQWPFILAIVGGTILAGLVLYYLLKKSKVAKSAAKNPTTKGTPFEIAMSALEALDHRSPAITSKQFYTQLTVIHRNYLQDAYLFRSYQQTGDEIILQAKPLLETDLFYNFANTVRLADAAKFAKYEPSRAEWVSSIASIKNTIIALEKKMQAAHSINQPQTPAVS